MSDFQNEYVSQLEQAVKGQQIELISKNTTIALYKQMLSKVSAENAQLTIDKQNLMNELATAIEQPKLL